MKKFMLSCRFNFEAYAKNVREKATKGCLETTEVLLNADLPKFDIYQGIVSPNCFKTQKFLMS